MKKNPHYFALLTAFIIVGALTWNSYFKSYYAKDTVDIKVFPQVIDDWTSAELPITDDEYAILETRNAFVRKYTSSQKEEVYLFIVYSQNNRKVSHPPELCYTGSGISVSKRAIETVPENGLKVNKLNLHKGKLNEVALYWFKVGETFTESYTRQQFLIAMKTILAKPSSSALIRVSTSIHDENESQAIELLKKFSNLILPDIQKHLP